MNRKMKFLVMALLVAVFVPGAAAQSAPITTTLKAVLKKIDDSSVVVTPTATKGAADVTFDLTAKVKKEGELTVGSPIVITYYYEAGKRVVTALTGKAAK